MNPLPKLLDTFEGRLRLEGVITTWTALHIGAGGSGDTLGTDSPVVRTAGGAPYIPGSSLKGVLRSAAEALFRGGPFQNDRKKLWACDPIAGKDRVCVTHERAELIRAAEEERAKKAKRDPDSRKVAEEIWEESCTVCQLFGSLALASRVRFADLPLRNEAPLLELRNGVGIDRDKELAASGVLYDFEAVPPETQFELRVTVDNPTDEEVGLLLYLFQELDAGNLTLGGKASRGLGRVRLRWEKIEEIKLQQANPFADLLSSRDLLALPKPAEEPAEDPLAGKIPTSGDPEAWKALAQILLALPKVDKGLMAAQAAAQDIKKDNAGEKLGLGSVRKPWDTVLDRFVTSGLLAKQGDGYVLAERKRPEGVGEASAETGRAPELQKLIDHYVGAMDRLWQEAS
ncbi:MAG TPA: CRISPR-associated RAMP protein Csx7 [Thermoanaerobaculia bacterium]|jgi:CRISPR-associated RAMP protein (TIGR02581 family)|nr:CRISPR-associated RAMP protein Csx7 [Thermoanaerobaculia bacterium]